MDLWVRLKQFLQSTSLSRASSDETKARQNQVGVKYDHISDCDEATDLKDILFKSRSIDEILDDIGLRLFHLKAFLLLGLLHMADSLGVSVLSIILPSIKSNWNFSSLMAGVLTLSMSAGMVVGSPFWGWVSDKYGRKRAFIGSATVILGFAFASAFSLNYYWLWISLFMVGFGVSSESQIHVVIVEIFPPKYRTMFALLHTAFWTLGFLLSSIVSLTLLEIGFNWTLTIVCAPTAIFLVGIVFFPDTSHYYLAAGEEQKALEVLQGLAPEIDLSNIRLKHGSDSKRADIAQLFRSGYWKITTCACITTFSIMIAYYALIYTSSHLAGDENNTATVTDRNSDNVTFNTIANSNLYQIMAWMNLPELAIVIAAGLGCYIFAVKRVLLTAISLPVLLQILSLLVYGRISLLVITMLSRSLLLADKSLAFLFASLLYPTQNRSIGVGACVAVGRLGTILGPFIFETLFVDEHLYGSSFNIAILLLAFAAVTLLPSHGATLR